MSINSFKSAATILSLGKNDSNDKRLGTIVVNAWERCKEKSVSLKIHLNTCRESINLPASAEFTKRMTLSGSVPGFFLMCLMSRDRFQFSFP